MLILWWCSTKMRRWWRTVEAVRAAWQCPRSVRDVLWYSGGMAMVKWVGYWTGRWEAPLLGIATLRSRSWASLPWKGLAWTAFLLGVAWFIDVPAAAAVKAFPQSRIDNWVELLTRPVQVMFMSWGRHSGWHWMHSDFSTNSLGSLGEEHSELWVPYHKWLWLFQVTQMTYPRNSKAS